MGRESSAPRLRRSDTTPGPPTVENECASPGHRQAGEQDERAPAERLAQDAAHGSCIRAESVSLEGWRAVWSGANSFIWRTCRELTRRVAERRKADDGGQRKVGIRAEELGRDDRQKSVTEDSRTGGSA
jgi:hypothetical protein